MPRNYLVICILGITPLSKGRFSLTYDNLLYLINRIEMMDPEMKKREPEDVKAMLDAYLRS